MNEEIKDFIRQENKKLIEEVAGVVENRIDNRVVQGVSDVMKDFMEVVETRIDDRVSDAEERIALSVHKTFQKIEDDLYAFRQEHAARMDRLEGRMDKLEGKMDKFEVRMDGLEVRMDGFENRMGKFEGKLDHVGRFVSTVYDNHEHRLRLMEAH